MKPIAYSLLLIVAALLFWNRYEYHEMKEMLVRTNRWTGSSEYFTLAGWKVAETHSTTETVSADTLGLLTGRAGLTVTTFTAHLYNGSEFNINEVVINFNVRRNPKLSSSSEPGFSRKLRLSGYAGALAYGDFSAEISAADASFITTSLSCSASTKPENWFYCWDWQMVSARGNFSSDQPH